MPTYYLDSSALIKQYHAERGSEEVQRIVKRTDSQHYVSRLTVLETQRAFAQRARLTHMTEAELQAVRGTFFRDLLQPHFHIERLREYHYHMAVRLVLTYWAERRQPLLRSLDAVQLAAALAVRDHVGLDYFVCTDSALCTLAEAERLTVFNPESP